MWLRFSAGLAVVAAAAIAFAVIFRPDPRHVAQVTAPPAASAAIEAPAAVQPEPEAELARATPPPARKVQPEPDYSDVAENEVFKADPQGRLVVGEPVRMYIEAMLNQADEQEIYQAKQEIRASLPPQAAMAAMDLFDRFSRYSEALDENDMARVPTNEAEAAERMDKLQRLRAEHFGAEAQALFASEDKVDRSYAELLRTQQDQGLSPEERDARAQSIRESVPEVQDLERRSQAAAELAAEDDESG